jgi:hypothetical protein
MKSAFWAALINGVTFGAYRIWKERRKEARDRAKETAKEMERITDKLNNQVKEKEQCE